MWSQRRVSGTATVVGGGPAGLMAAEVLAAAGMSVTVYEHMASVGRKLLLAGRTGLNLTHSEPFDQFLTRYGVAAPRFDGPMRAFGPAALRAWSAELGEQTFVGSTGRVFPQSMRATPLLRAWLARLAASGVRFETRWRWLGWTAATTATTATTATAADEDRRDGPVRSRFCDAGGVEVEVASDVTVLALGGASWPRVGSDGGWVEPLRAAGIAVTELRPANCGVQISWTAGFATRFAGEPLKNIALEVAGQRVRGDATITRTGLESGPVYTVASAIRAVIERDGRCTVHVDLHPDLEARVLADRLRRGRKKDSQTTALRRTVGLSPTAVAVLREATGNRLPTDPNALAALVKAVPLIVEATMPLERAISTAGGIALDEIDDAFMLVGMPGTFVAGEMLDWDAPTGGYLLQATFSSAVAAAQGAIAWHMATAPGRAP
ncbi:MAG: family flavoprotein [Ilumatobacteraceae bacterium]|nr:family flavoprotein [Ilumatobacteraceae bacterium]